MSADTSGMTSTRNSDEVSSSPPTTGQLVKRGAIAGVIAAVATTAVAGVAGAADVSLAVDDQAIPIAAFAWWTIVGAALGVAAARLLRSRRRFMTAMTIATALSLIPAILVPDHTATKIVLVGTHLLAAVIIVPTLARVLANPQRT
jgi:Family of unknown function (DUF6069)